MANPRLKPEPNIKFLCVECGHTFETKPDRIDDNDERPWHPFDYYSDCPECLHLSPQDPRQRGLFKAWAHATGPRTAEGLAQSANNLKGHPTPEESRITRFNAITHGMTAEVANYYPAKPGKYAQCQACEYFDEECIANPPRTHKNPPACLKKTELFMRHQLAFETGDVKVLTGIRANTQAALQGIIDEMILQIAQDGGPRIMELKWYYDKEGTFHLAQYTDEETNEKVKIYEHKAHPLLKPLIDFISKNSLTLSDMGMTPKVQQDNDLISGHLSRKASDEQSFSDHQKAQTDQLEDLKKMIENSKKAIAKDDILLEYNQEQKDG